MEVKQRKSLKKFLALTMFCQTQTNVNNMIICELIQIKVRPKVITKMIRATKSIKILLALVETRKRTDNILNTLKQLLEIKTADNIHFTVILPNMDRMQIESLVLASRAFMKMLDKGTRNSRNKCKKNLSSGSVKNKSITSECDSSKKNIGKTIPQVKTNSGDQAQGLLTHSTPHLSSG